MDDFRKFRAQGIGGSDLYTMLGLNKHKSMYDLYLEKTKPLDEIKDYKSLLMSSGKALENVILDEYERLHGNQLERDVQIVSDEAPYIRANLDAIDRENNYVIEAKSVFFYGDADAWG